MVILFIYNHYYPNGGALDIKGIYKDVFEAMESSFPIIESADSNSGFSGEIIDSSTLCLLAEYDCTKREWINKNLQFLCDYKKEQSCL